MIGTYEERRVTVRALKLTPETVDELVRWTDGYLLTADLWIPSAHAWHTSPPGRYFFLDGGAPYMFHPGGSPFVGILTGVGAAVVEPGGWVVQPSGNGGGFRVVSADHFDDLYTAVQP